MTFNLFKKEGKKKKSPLRQPAEEAGKKEDFVVAKESGSVFPMQTGNVEAYRVLKNFYISEKASLLNGLSQYVFKVFRSANKSQIRKQVEKLFSVKVTSVKILNMPRKRRDLGRHPSFRSEFKKAIVVLEKGQTIEQAKP